MSDPNWPPPAPPPYESATPSAAPGTYAGWGLRAGALIIDTLLIVAAVVAAAFAAGTGTGGELVFAVVGLGAFLYPPLLMMRTGDHNGQTLGKQAVGIRVVREAGHPLGFWWAALREMLAKGVLSLLTIPILLSYLWPLWDERKQALHDKMASTFVVQA